jgi:hypothetical protein
LRSCVGLIHLVLHHFVINGNFNPSNFAALTTLTLGSIVRIGFLVNQVLISITQGCGGLTTLHLGYLNKLVILLILLLHVLSAASVNAIVIVPH